MSREQTQTKICFNANIIINSKNHHLLPKMFNTAILNKCSKYLQNFEISAI